MNEELDSQLSAMFDDELPEDQCQLLARRLSRDDALKARWRRYAVVGAAIRAERGVRPRNQSRGARQRGDLCRTGACRARRSPSGETSKRSASAGGSPSSAVPSPPAWRPCLCCGFGRKPRLAEPIWSRRIRPRTTISASVSGAPTSAVADNSAPETYVVPAAVERTPIVPTAELANYVVAHSEFSAPVSRRNLLSALVASEMASEMPSEVGTTAANEESDDAEEAVATPVVIPASNGSNVPKAQNAR